MRRPIPLGLHASSSPAADAEERSAFFEQLASRYEALRVDKAAWREIEAERALEAGTLNDDH
jgi:hypothetical protein